MTNEDWASIARPVALEVLGEPTSESSSEMRWNKKGSMCLNKDTGQFYDFENREGGGTHWFLNKFDVDVKETLDRFGFSDVGENLGTTYFFPSQKVSKPSASLSSEELRKLWTEAVVKIKYADNFIVLRFPEGHKRSYQKYCPFSKQENDQWLMKRPSGQLPLYLTPNRDATLPVVLVEGEKAAIAAEKIYEGQVACHHGGVSGWSKTDWSPLFGRDVFIFPDNDDAGFGFANDIGTYLETHKCNVWKAKPPVELNEKEDLHEALEKGIFSSSDVFVNYVKSNPLQRPKGTFYLERADKLMSEVDHPEWLIKNVVERSSLLGIFGKPKDGKSFVAIAMAASIAKGSNYYGYETTQAPVVLLAGEGLRGVKRRLAVYSQEMHDLSGCPLFLSNRGTRVLDDDEFEKLKQELDLIEAKQGSIGCIIFDTLNRNFGSGSENSTEDMTLFISRLDSLIHKYNAAVIVVHHTGHNNFGRQRGSSVLGASMDYEFKVTRENSGGHMFVTVEQTLNKDGMGMATMDFKFVEAQINGFDGLTSGYLELTEDKPEIKKSMNAAHAMIDKALTNLATLKVVADGGASEDYWFKPSDLTGKVKKVRGEGIMSDGNIRTYLSKMKESDDICHDPKTDTYQSIQYKRKVDFDEIN